MKHMNYQGETFLAFADISGFKKLMKRGKGPEALNAFYNGGYNLLSHRDVCDYITGVFVSDCGIMFTRNNCNPERDNVTSLKELLKIIKKLNKIMLVHGKMLTTSVAYGPFTYENRIVLPNLGKEYFHGDAYLEAYLDNNDGKPKIQPGQCRILIENLVPDVKAALETSSSRDQILKMVKTRKGDRKHYYFYWMREEPTNIEKFEEDYSDSYELEFGGMLEALKGNHRRTNTNIF